MMSDFSFLASSYPNPIFSITPAAKLLISTSLLRIRLRAISLASRCLKFSESDFLP